jgi:hypothetical protein
MIIHYLNLLMSFKKLRFSFLLFSPKKRMMEKTKREVFYALQ